MGEGDQNKLRELEENFGKIQRKNEKKAILEVLERKLSGI